MESAKELQSRWSEELIEATLARIRCGQMSEPFGRTEAGLVDMRGLSIRGIIKKVSITDVDMRFCYTQRGGQFGDCVFNRINFSRAKLQTTIDGVFSECKFERTNLVNTLFRGKFINSSFLNANLKGATGGRLSFQNCRFDEANFQFADFDGTIFEACSWRSVNFGNGSFGRCKFIGSSPTEVGNTIMDCAEIS